MNLHTATSPDCPVCLGHGQVCEMHPGLAWGPGLPSGSFPPERVCWCGAGPRPCILAVEDPDDIEPGPTRNSDLQDMLKWALVAAAITLVFGVVAQRAGGTALMAKTSIEWSDATWNPGTALDGRQWAQMP